MKVYEVNNSMSVINLEGNLTSESADELNQLHTQTLEKDVSTLVLNFTGLEHMNSAGVNQLIKLATLAKKNKQKLLAIGLNNRYIEIFYLTGLSEGISVIEDMAKGLAYLNKDTISRLEEMVSTDFQQNDYGWAHYMSKLSTENMPKEAMNKNVRGRRVLGPLQGFGPMWEKNYVLTINRCKLKPSELISIMKEHLPEFQPVQNKFYSSPQGIAPGEVVLIDSKTPGGIVSTGVMVLYADETSFSLITPQGHPEAGWVTFSAREKGDDTIVQIQGLASAEDPFYEIAFSIVGSKFQETIWTHVLSSMASYLGVKPDVQISKSCIIHNFQWRKSGNIWYNAQIRSLPYNLTRLIGRTNRKSK